MYDDNLGQWLCHPDADCLWQLLQRELCHFTVRGVKWNGCQDRCSVHDQGFSRYDHHRLQHNTCSGCSSIVNDNKLDPRHQLSNFCHLGLLQLIYLFIVVFVFLACSEPNVFTIGSNLAHHHLQSFMGRAINSDIRGTIVNSIAHLHAEGECCMPGHRWPIWLLQRQLFQVQLQQCALQPLVCWHQVYG